MHILGKVLLWLNVIGAIAACVLAAKLFDVRNSWSRRIDQLQQEVAQNETRITQQSAEFERLTEEYHRTMLGWGRNWDGVQGGITPQGQLFAQNLGRAAGLGASSDPANPGPLPIVYAFQTQPNGQSRYIGSFQAQQIQDTSSTFTPTWDAAQDLAGIQGGTFRIRGEIPARYTSEFVNLRMSRTVAQREVQDHTRYVQQQVAQESQADTVLKLRMEELQGTANQPGLVAELASAEQARNAELVRLDQLRREVKSIHGDIRDLVTDVRRIEDQLDGQEEQ